MRGACVGIALAPDGQDMLTVLLAKDATLTCCKLETSTMGVVRCSLDVDQAAMMSDAMALRDGLVRATMCVRHSPADQPPTSRAASSTYISVVTAIQATPRRPRPTPPDLG